MIDIIPNWHPFFVHFTVALLTLSLLFYALAAVWRTAPLREQWFTYGHWNLWLGVAFSGLTVLAGWYAFNTVIHDTPSHAAMTDHRNWALVTIAVFSGLAVWAFFIVRQKSTPTVSFLILGFVGLLLLTSTGWRGAELVYRYGLGVMSLPKVERHSHGSGESSHDTTHDSIKMDGQNPKHSSTGDSTATEKQATGNDHHDDGHAHEH